MKITYNNRPVEIVAMERTYISLASWLDTEDFAYLTEDELDALNDFLGSGLGCLYAEWRL